MVTTLSPEGRINAGLQELQCSGRNFIEIAKILGAPIATGSFSEGLTGKRQFDRKIGERLLEILSRMRRLQDSISVPVHWARADAIANALMTRLVAQVAAQMHDPGTEQFERYAKDAEQFVF